MTYNSWKLEDCTVDEDDYDHDLHMFRVTWHNGKAQDIIPATIDDMKATRGRLDALAEDRHSACRRGLGRRHGQPGTLLKRYRNARKEDLCNAA